jgi:subfamily B ATP-binding cassette protein MsbA
MKNFVRLVQFAWRYKIRFGLSVCCAVMVALLFFTELGAVYPLLHILFGSQNPQRWISEKIAGVETEIVTLHAREEEARQVLLDAQSGQSRLDDLRQRFQRVHEKFEKTEAELRKHERNFNVADLK